MHGARPMFLDARASVSHSRRRVTRHERDPVKALHHDLLLHACTVCTLHVVVFIFHSKMSISECLMAHFFLAGLAPRTPL